MRSVVIHFEPGQDEQGRLVHRLRNFGEVVWRQVRNADWGSVSLDEVDRATTQFSITDVHAKKLRRLTTWIQQEADLQHLKIVMKVA
jgi:hypothetical protein